MAAMFGSRELCNVMGREIFRSKKEGRDALGAWARAKGSRRVFRCIFCDGYHMTKGQRGPRKGRG